MRGELLVCLPKLRTNRIRRVAPPVPLGSRFARRGDGVYRSRLSLPGTRRLDARCPRKHLGKCLGRPRKRLGKRCPRKRLGKRATSWRTATTSMATRSTDDLVIMFNV